jgi:hypothetical protein
MIPIILFAVFIFCVCLLWDEIKKSPIEANTEVLGVCTKLVCDKCGKADYAFCEEFNETNDVLPYWEQWECCQVCGAKTGPKSDIKVLWESSKSI